MNDSAEDTLLAALARAVVERFAPERIVLFGSRARGDHGPDSDYDVMVVLDDGSGPAEGVVRAIHDIQTNVDVIVATCDQFERRRIDVGTLEYVADHEGRILYARTSPPRPRQVREPPNGPPESLDAWIARADSDFAAMAALNMVHPSNLHDAIVFHAHQGVEKTLKAALVARHVQPPRTHVLPDLLHRLPAELRDDPSLRDACAGLHALWPASRYPTVPVPTGAQVDQAVAWAERARAIVRLAVDP
jgi:HEPN domain-containing protein/predicted nucleotidyltransferase